MTDALAAGHLQFQYYIRPPTPTKPVQILIDDDVIHVNRSFVLSPCGRQQYNVGTYFSYEIYLIYIIIDPMSNHPVTNEKYIPKAQAPN